MKFLAPKTTKIYCLSTSFFLLLGLEDILSALARLVLYEEEEEGPG